MLMLARAGFVTAAAGTSNIEKTGHNIAMLMLASAGLVAAAVATSNIELKTGQNIAKLGADSQPKRGRKGGQELFQLIMRFGPPENRFSRAAASLWVSLWHSMHCGTVGLSSGGPAEPPPRLLR